MRTTCPSCERLLPELVALADQEAGKVDVVGVYLDWPPGVTKRRSNLTMIGVDADVAAFNVEATPYAIAIDDTGVVAGNGIVNTPDHLASLARLITSGIADDAVGTR